MKLTGGHKVGVSYRVCTLVFANTDDATGRLHKVTAPRATHIPAHKCWGLICVMIVQKKATMHRQMQKTLWNDAICLPRGVQRRM